MGKYVVIKVDKKITISKTGTETGAFQIPIGNGGKPRKGQVLIIDDESMSQEYTIASVLSVDSPEFRYLNFRKIPDNADPSVLEKDGGENDTIPLAKRSKNAFNDIPDGTRTMEATNGAVVMAGSEICGMAMSSSNKIILRNNNAMEMITPHSIQLLGQCVKVSSFKEGFTLEIDLISDNKESPITPIIDEIHASILDGDSYDVAFQKALGNSGSFEKRFIQLFGIHIAEIVTVHKWMRIKIVGNVENVLNDYFPGTSGVFDFSELSYYGDLAKIRSIEAHLVDVYPRDVISVHGALSCGDTRDTIIGINCVTNGEQRAVSTVVIHMTNGELITYGNSVTSYAVKSFDMSGERFTSAIIHKSSASQFHRDHTEELISHITLGVTGTSLCNQSVSYSGITFATDAIINIGGDLSVFTGGDVELSSPSIIKLSAAGRGIVIDSSGVSTTN